MDGEWVYYCKNGGTEEKREEVLKVELRGPKKLKKDGEI